MSEEENQFNTLKRAIELSHALRLSEFQELLTKVVILFGYSNYNISQKLALIEVVLDAAARKIKKAEEVLNDDKSQDEKKQRASLDLTIYSNIATEFRGYLTMKQSEREMH